MSNEPSYYRARFAAFGAALTYENSLPESRERQMRISYLRNGFVPDNFLQKAEYEFNIGSGLYRTIPQFIKEFTKNDNSPLSQVELQTLDTWFVVNPEKICGVQKGGSGYSFPVKTIGTKQDIINAIDKTLSSGKNKLSPEDEYNNKTLDELISIKKKLYSNVDIESPMSDDEKLLNRIISQKFSVINQENHKKHKELQANKAKSANKLTIYKYKAKAIALKLKLQND